MKTGLIIGIVIAILIVGGIYLISTNEKITENQGNEGINNVGTNNININNFAYSPIEIRIKAGDTLTWTNQDSALHTVTSDSGNELNSASLGNGQTYSHTFNTAGTYNYYCSIHPYMKAKVIVQ